MPIVYLAVFWGEKEVPIAFGQSLQTYSGNGHEGTSGQHNRHVVSDFKSLLATPLFLESANFRSCS